MRRKNWVAGERRTRGLAHLLGQPSCRGREPGAPAAKPWKTLICHPSCQGAGDWQLRVKPSWAREGALRLVYHLSAPRSALAIPPRISPGRQDGLWRHSCCEAFISLFEEASYLEFNFSPSGAWALYAFADERVPLPMPQVEGLKKLPVVCCERRRHAWRLRAHIPQDLLPKPQPGQILLLGLAAVVEDQQGRLTYWALEHPCPLPDFHHPGGRVLPWSRPVNKDCQA
jgi:hypothetical protein